MQSCQRTGQINVCIDLAAYVWEVQAYQSHRMATISHVPSEVARALASLRQLGVAAFGSLEHAECGGCRQLRSYNSAAQLRGGHDRPVHRPRVYEASSASQSFTVDLLSGLSKSRMHGLLHAHAQVSHGAQAKAIMLVLHNRPTAAAGE